MSGRLSVTARQAAALDRLLDAYIGNDEQDPGMDDLAALRTKVGRLEQDHAVYERPQQRVHLRAVLDPEIPVCRRDVAEGERLGGEREGNCPDCLNIRAGGAITRKEYRS